MGTRTLNSNGSANTLPSTGSIESKVYQRRADETGPKATLLLPVSAHQLAKLGAAESYQTMQAWVTDAVRAHYAACKRGAKPALNADKVYAGRDQRKGRVYARTDR